VATGDLLVALYIQNLSIFQDKITLFIKKSCIFYRTKSDLDMVRHPKEHSFILSDQFRTAADGQKNPFGYVLPMLESTEKDEMNQQKKDKKEIKPPARRKKVLKVGGLWVDPLRFPSFDDEKDPGLTPRS
jgi:hypothetical protein